MHRARLFAFLIAVAPQWLLAAEPFEQGMVSVTLDDGWDTQFTTALPILRAHQIKAVFFLTTQAIDESWTYFMHEEQVQELAALGYEIESHTVNHPDLTTVSTEELELQLAQSQQWLRAELGSDVATHFAAPFGRYDDTVIAAVKRYYSSCRTVNNGRNWRDGDPYELFSYDVHSHVSVDDVHRWLVAAQQERSWIILTFHEFFARPPQRSTEINTADFDAILSDINELGLKVVGIDEGVALMAQSTALTSGEKADPAPVVHKRDASAGGCRAVGGNIWTMGGLVLIGLAVLRRRRRDLWRSCLIVLVSLAQVHCGKDGRAQAPPDGSEPAPGDPSDDPPGDVDTGPPAVRFIGRFDTRDPQAPLAAWPGARIIANFRGTGVSVQLEELTLDWQEGGPSEMDVAIDGAWHRLVLELGTHTYDLAGELAPGVHQVELYRSTEAQNGFTRFLGFDFGEGELLAPPRRKDHRIEVIGDSASSGFGVLGVGLGPNCPGFDWAAKYQDFRLAWGARLGERLAAEVHGTVYSGKGIVRNIWREDTLTMPRIYPRANPFDPDSTYDLSSYVPQVLLMMLGGNDFMVGLPVDDGPLAPEVFQAALDDFVGVLRAAYPATDIILVLSPTSLYTAESGPVEVRGYVQQSMVGVYEARRAAGDLHIHYVEPTPATPEELTGCNGHGSPEFHERLAAELEQFVRGITGW